MIFLSNKILFSWLVLASSLNVFFSVSARFFKLSTGLGNAICTQNQNYAETSQIQPPLKSGSGSSCGWGVLKTPEAAFVKPCSAIRTGKGNSGISPKVTDGEPTEPGEFPSLVTIYQYFDDIIAPEPPFNETIPAHWQLQCSGILISEEWVLTQEPCFHYLRLENNLSNSRIYAGKYNHTPGTDPDTEQGPSQPVEFADNPHPNMWNYLRLNFTLTKFSPPFKLTERVQLAHFPQADEGLPKPKDPVTLVGYGSLIRIADPNNYSYPESPEFVPNKRTMEVMDQQKCKDLLKNGRAYDIGPEQFCLEDGQMSGPWEKDNGGFSVDADGKQTFIAFKNIWYPEYSLPPLMTATSFLREWVEGVVGKVA